MAHRHEIGAIAEPAVLGAILSYNINHPANSGWNHRDHYGGCGQSCPCCRARVEEDASGCCESCEDFAQYLAVSKLWKLMAKACMYQQERGKWRPSRERQAVQDIS